MDKKMETTYYSGFRVQGLGFERNGRENGNDHNGLYIDY